MATKFRIGQRVRHIYDGPCSVPKGLEGVIEARWRGKHFGAHPDWKWLVRFDGFAGSTHTSGCVPCAEYTLAPLTDPAADAFLSRIKNLKPYEEPVAPKSKVRA